MSNHATKKESEHAADIDTSDLAPNKYLIPLKGEVNKLDVNKLANCPTSLNNLKTKVNDLDFGKLKAVPVYLKKLSDVVGNKVVENTKFKSLKSKVNNLEKAIPDPTTFIHIK